MTTTYLKATLQKDYYKKAQVLEDDYFIILKSYNTQVIAIDKIDNSIVRLWNGWSVTTAKHINDFLIQNGFKALSKKEWLNMPCVNNEPVYNIYMSNGFFTHKSNILLTEEEAENEINRLYDKDNSRRWSVWYE